MITDTMIAAGVPLWQHRERSRASIRAMLHLITPPEGSRRDLDARNEAAAAAVWATGRHRLGFSAAALAASLAASPP